MNSVFLCIPVFFPIIAGLASYLIRFKSEGARRAFYTAVICATTAVVWVLILNVSTEPFTLLHFTDKLNFTLRLDGAGKIFAALSSSLWPLTMLYAFDYMKHEKHKNMFWSFFTVSFGVTMGIAMASNLLTMYLFYEMLTLATVPLVIHGMDKTAFAAGKKYMIYSFGGAAFAFITLAFLINSGLPDFVCGGALQNYSGSLNAELAFYCVAFVGFGVKAALFPLHGWLPAASVAPTPVTALLHSVAVVKAGAFAVIRLTYYTFDPKVLSGTWAQSFVLIITAVTIVFGSAKALKQTHFKRRLAYSTVANLSYILFAAALMSQSGLVASFVHMLFHSLIKIVAFFAAGAVLHYTGKQYVNELEGIGRRMPLTFAAFTVSALALTGVPPLNGFISKWYIAGAAVENGGGAAIAGVAALLISALLTAVYMLTVVVRAYFPRKGKETLCPADTCKEAGALMTVPMLLISAATVLSGLFAGQLAALIEKAVLM